MKQAREFSERYGGTADKVIKTITLVQSNHPWTILRAGELIKWVESGEYDRILNKTLGKTCPKCGGEIAQDAIICPRCNYQFPPEA